MGYPKYFVHQELEIVSEQVFDQTGFTETVETLEVVLVIGSIFEQW